MLEKIKNVYQDARTYFANNKPLFFVIVGVAVILLIAIIALICKASKKKKNKKLAAQATKQAAATEPKPVEEPKQETTVEEKAEPVVEETKEEPATEEKKSTKYNGKWFVYKMTTEGSNDAVFFFELHASNGEKLMSSNEYPSYSGAMAGMETHKTNIENGNFKISLSKKGDYIYKLLNAKNTLLCMGEHYATKTRCQNAIESVKRFAKTAVVVEEVQNIVLPKDEAEEKEEVVYTGKTLGKWILHEADGEDGEKIYYFDLVANNGERLMSSEEYTTYDGAVAGIETHKTNIEKNRFRITRTKKGDYIYKLLNGNNQLLCLGENYKTKGRCESAVESVKHFAKDAVLTDGEEIKK